MRDDDWLELIGLTQDLLGAVSGPRWVDFVQCIRVSAQVVCVVGLQVRGVLVEDRRRCQVSGLEPSRTPQDR